MSIFNRLFKAYMGEQTKKRKEKNKRDLKQPHQLQNCLLHLASKDNVGLVVNRVSVLDPNSAVS